MDKYHVIPMSILSSAKMTGRVRLILERIRPVSLTEDKKRPTVVALRAKLAVAGKMISIVEIAKNNIQETGGQWWQYSTMAVLQNANTEVFTTSSLSARHSDGTSPSSWRRGGLNESKRDLVDRQTLEPEEDFETMPPLNSTSVCEASSDARGRAHMIIYLASVPIPELKELYG